MIPRPCSSTDRRPGASGSVVVPVLEGARPMLVEMQALVAISYAPMPRRSAQGLDASRFSLLLAVLERRAQQRLNGCDVYASVAGGVRVSEAGADLGIALAVASAQADLPVPPTTVVLGEIGLGGEVRQVPHTPRRLAEAARLGFTRAIVPHSSPDVAGVHSMRVRDVREALAAVGLLAIERDPGAATVDGEPDRARYPRPVAVRPIAVARGGVTRTWYPRALEAATARTASRTRQRTVSHWLIQPDLQEAIARCRSQCAPKRYSPRCVSSPPGDRCARGSTASSRRRWVR